jgi:hypothetical protein
MKRASCVAAASMRPVKKKSGPWANALDQYCLAPQDHKDVVHSYDDSIVVIKDQFPKV